ncbi:GNAT family N-acetyltransferase, partial [Alkalibacterium sp. 20]|uniref:GNAT family N-acetyltransferase n=1 Tax=Alkalibacterium sp. 20 TaxID=1798803 RepID=UPI00090038D7
FHDYCLKNNNISEFIRFHLFENHDVLEGFNGKKILVHSVICRDLKKPSDQDLESRLIKDVKKAENFGLTVEFDYTGTSKMDFLRIYTETMNRNQAKDFYYIDQTFLDKLQKNLDGQFLYANTRLNGEVIASRLIIFDDKYGYYFLGGNSKEYYKYKNGTFLDYKLLIELKDKGLKSYVFGGGYEGEDGIYKYKKKFDKLGEVPFYIGKKIHMEKEYQHLTLLRKEEGHYNSETLFFPLYRAPRNN